MGGCWSKSADTTDDDPLIKQFSRRDGGNQNLQRGPKDRQGPQIDVHNGQDRDGHDAARKQTSKRDSGNQKRGPKGRIGPRIDTHNGRDGDPRERDSRDGQKVREGRMRRDSRDERGRRDSRDGRYSRDRQGLQDRRDGHKERDGRGGGRDRWDRKTRRFRDRSGLEAYEDGLSDMLLDETEFARKDKNDRKKGMRGPPFDRSGNRDDDDYYYDDDYVPNDSAEYTTSFDDVIEMLGEPYTDETRGTSTQTYYGSSRYTGTSRYPTTGRPSRRRRQRDSYDYDEYDYDDKDTGNSFDERSLPYVGGGGKRKKEIPPRGRRFQIMPSPTMKRQTAAIGDTDSLQMDPLDRAIRELGADTEVGGNKPAITCVNPLSALKSRSAMRATGSLRLSDKRNIAFKKNPYSLAAVVEEEVLSRRPTRQYCE